MGVRYFWRMLVSKLRPRRHRGIKSFEQELQAAGGVRGRVDVGARIVPTDKIVGSVSRWQNLRSDFFYKSGEVTGRFLRIGEAMLRGKTLPPIDVYKMKRPIPEAPEQGPISEYYVVDGHHRVAMARRHGQDFLDANVIEYKVSGGTQDAKGIVPASDASEAPNKDLSGPGAS